MSIIILIVVVALALRFYYEWHSLTIIRRNMTPEQRKQADEFAEQRKARIIERGRFEHEEYKRKHPTMGVFHKFNEQDYYLKHGTDIVNYP